MTNHDASFRRWRRYYAGALAISFLTALIFTIIWTNVRVERSQRLFCEWIGTTASPVPAPSTLRGIDQQHKAEELYRRIECPALTTEEK